MERLGEHTWKQFYSRERERYRHSIDECIVGWRDRKDEKVGKVIAKGGALSFPHTYLSSSMEAQVRTASAVISLKRKKVIAFGVLHRISRTIEYEFSLDNFLYILERTADLHNVDPPEVETIFLPRLQYNENGPQRMVQDLTDEVEHITKKDLSDTAFVLTGDLCHYGRKYGTENIVEDPDHMILDRIREGLDLIYLRNDNKGYISHARSNLNDQWAIAVALRSLLPEQLQWEILSYHLSDYSKVLDSEPPCLVASTFYGVFPRN
jgi:predicted class III extradiol MEMO1 family dioxygenase